MNKKLLIGSIFALVLLTLLQIPFKQNRVVSYGQDTYSAHRHLYADKTLEQDVVTTNTLTGIGSILVDLKRSKQITPVLVEVKDKTTGDILVSANIPVSAIQDDKFAYTSFPNTSIPKGREITIVFRAPDATSKNLLGLRFDRTNNHLSLALTERVPLWRAFATTIQNKGDTWGVIAIVLVASIILGLLSAYSHHTTSWVVAVCILVIGAFAVRAATVPYFGGVSGGDAYNYLFTSKAISQWRNPLENTKRLPGYPLILTPFYSSRLFDDHHVMRYTQIIASIAGILLLAGITRVLKLPWTVAITACAILAFQKDYYFTSLRPEPYTLYTALLLGAVFLFFKSYTSKKIWIHIFFGFCLGYAAMVRQEGFVLAALLGTCSLLFEIARGKSITRIVAMYLPALCIVMPFFVHNTVTYGHPLYTEYFEGDRLQIVDSIGAFQDSLGATWGVISSMWKPSWDSLQRVPLTTPLFVTSAVLLWTWYVCLKKYKNSPYTSFITITVSIVWTSVVFASVYLQPLVAGVIPIITSAWILASIPLFLIETSWKGLVVFLVCVSQILIATWFHPFPKHYQQSYPFIILIISTALVSQIPVKKKSLVMSTVALSTLPFFIVAGYLSKNINAELDRYNENTALDSVAYRAARYARNLPGPVAFDQAYLPARLYFDPNAIYFPDEEHPTRTMEEEWLQKNSLKTIVVTNGNNVFKNIPDSWQKIKDFKAAGNDEKIFVATIYAIPF